MDVLLRISEETGLSLDRLVSPSAALCNSLSSKHALVDQILELASEFVEKRIGFQKPPAKTIMNWLVENGSKIDVGDPMVAQIEVFKKPNRSDPMPIPLVVGHQSLISLEAGIKSPDHLQSLIRHSSRELMQSIAGDHLSAADGRPNLERKTITLDTASVQVSCDYDRLLAPAQFNGTKVVLSYSVAVDLRKGRVNHGNELDPARSGQPVLSRSV